MAETHRTAVYTGSFDPVTLGHQSVIQRSAKLFDEVVVAVGLNVEKQMLFSTDERVELLQSVTDALANVRVTTFDGLAVDYVRSIGSRVMIRGLRPLTDTAGEFTMMMANRQLDQEIETVFLMSDEQFAHVSSSLIKQITPLSSNERLARFVPELIIPALREKIPQRNGSR